jgi:hypothetical protein
MQIRGFFGRRPWVAACAVFAALTAASTARAETINTYTFFQSGWNAIINVTGHFTGKVGDDGYMRAGDLTEFDATGFDFTASGHPSAFSFDTTAPNNATTLFIVDPVQETDRGELLTYCTGAATFLVCHGQNDAGVMEGDAGSIYTTSFPVITLVSSKQIVDPISDPTPRSTPIPGALLLFATGLGGLAPLAAMKRRLGRTA